MRPLATVILSLGLTACLNFSPGTPSTTGTTGTTTGTGGMQDAGVAPQKHADMATAPSTPPQTSTDMAVAPLGTELCDATLALAGTFVQGDPMPADFPGGCWPDGTWTFTATVTQNGGCTTPPQLQAQYQFKVVEDDDYNDTITYLNDPTNMYVAMKISGGEGGVCVGAFQIFSSDGKTITNLRPAMQADNSINGAGDYGVWDADQRN